MDNAFGQTLLYWRKTRKKSQMELALEANVSTRHLSFVESGKARPSRDLILKLAGALKLSYRQSNALLNTAGFTAMYPEPFLSEDQMTPVKVALEFMLKKHEPFPAVAIKSNYDILISNAGFKHLAEWLAGKGILEKYPNVYQLIFANDGLKPYFENWENIASALLTRLHEEWLISQNETVFKLYEDLKIETSKQETHLDPNIPVISFILKKKKVKLELFSALTSFSTPMNIPAQEVRVESIFPLNDETREFFAMLT